MTVPVSYGKSDRFIILVALNKVMLPYITNSHFPLSFDVFAIHRTCHLQYASQNIILFCEQLRWVMFVCALRMNA